MPTTEDRYYEQLGQQYSTEATMGGVAGSINILKDRWWKKEAEEFVEAAGNEFKESMYKVGEIGADETSQDMEGMWKTYQGAVTTFIQKASMYRENPYISQFSEKMVEQQKKMWTELTGGISAEAQATTAATGRMREEGEAGLRPARKESLLAGAELARAQAAKARRDEKAGLGLPKKTAFGLDAEVVRNTPIPVLLGNLRVTDTYKDMLARKQEEVGGVAWDKLSEAEKKKIAGPAGIQMTDADLRGEFIKTYPLNRDEEREIDRQAATLALAQSWGPHLPMHTQAALVDAALGPDQGPMDNIRKEVPKISRRTMLNKESPAMNTLLLGTRANALTNNANVLEDPPTAKDLMEQAPHSPLGQVVKSYWDKRNAGTDHPTAVTEIFRPLKGKSLVDELVEQRFDQLSVGDVVQDRNIENFRASLIELLDDTYQEYYEDTVFEQGRFLRGEEGISLEGMYRGLKRVPLVGTAIRSLTEEEPPPTLAREGLRTGGRVVPPPRIVPKRRLPRELQIRRGIPALNPQEIRKASKEAATSARAKDIKSRTP